MDIINKPVNLGLHHAELMEHWLNFFLPSSCFTANVLSLQDGHLWAVQSPLIMMVHNGTDSISVQMCSHAFFRHSQPCFYLCANPIPYSEAGLMGEDKRLRLPPVTLNIVGWYKLAMALLKLGQLHQLYHVWWSALHLYKSTDGHTRTFFPAALLRKWPFLMMLGSYGTVIVLEARKHMQQKPRCPAHWGCNNPVSVMKV